MSESAPEVRAPAGKSGNIFTRKIGPMPMWAWLAIVSVAIIAWAWYQNKKTPSTAPTDTANASQVPQFVNQVYTSTAPPSTPGTGTTGTGVGQVAVPNVVGMTDTAGDAAIKAAGLKVADTNEKKPYPGGGTKITGQSPAAGTMVALGSSVSVTLATGSKKDKGGGTAQPAAPSGHPVKKTPAKRPHPTHAGA